MDTGEDISLLKPDNLDTTKPFVPEGMVHVKSVSRFVIRVKGTVQAIMYEGSVRIPFTFQLADKQVDLPCNGILGRDFLAHAGTKISYETGVLTLGTGSAKIQCYHQ